MSKQEWNQIKAEYTARVEVANSLSNKRQAQQVKAEAADNLVRAMSRGGEGPMK